MYISLNKIIIISVKKKNKGKEKAQKTATYSYTLKNFTRVHKSLADLVFTSKIFIGI